MDDKERNWWIPLHVQELQKGVRYRFICAGNVVVFGDIKDLFVDERGHLLVIYLDDVVINDVQYSSLILCGPTVIGYLKD